MDIHRARFVPFPASPINALAFSRTTDHPSLLPPAPHHVPLKLALGRANGSIEIWNPDRGDWVQEVVFPGGEGRSIEGLVWTRDPDEYDDGGKELRAVGQMRLFSIGSAAGVAEWDLGRGTVRRTATGNFSEVWCFAAQPEHAAAAAEREGVWTGQDIVAGCGDGTLVVLSTADDDLTFKRTLARSGSRKTRCVSVVWQNRDRVVAGFSDSNIRVYDARNGSLLRNMSLGAGIPGAPKDTLVWRVKTLPSGDIVSADSNGEIRIWDGKAYNMVQRITGHESDCLDLVTSTDGQTIFSGGIDGRMATYTLHGRDGAKRRWARASHRRMHQGDVKSMAIHDSKRLSVVATGGADTVPWVVPVRQSQREHSRRLPGLPQRQPCISAPAARLLVSWWGRSVWIWRFAKQHAGFTPDVKSKTLVSKLSISGDEDVSSVDISQDGRLLLVTTSKTTKAFQLRPSKNVGDSRLRVASVRLPEDVQNEGATLVAVSPDARWITSINLDNEIKVMRVVDSTSDPKRLAVLPEVVELDRTSGKATAHSSAKMYERTINNVVYSTDSRYLCVSDVSGHIDAFILDGDLDLASSPASRIRPSAKAKNSAPRRPSTSDSDSDSSEDEDDLPVAFFGQTWNLSPTAERIPKLESAPLLLSFHPHQPCKHLLLIITQHHHLYEFDIFTGKLSDWSRRNPTGVLPSELRTIKDRVMGVAWDYRPNAGNAGARHDRVWLYGSSWLALLDLRKDFAVPHAKQIASDSYKHVVLANGKRRISEHDKWNARNLDRKRRKGAAGAGDRMDENEMGGAPTAVVVADADGNEQSSRDTEAAVTSDFDAADLMDIDAEDSGPLRRLNEADDDRSDKDEEKAGSNLGRLWWCTYKYRPILGLVPIARHGYHTAAEGGVVRDQDGDENPLEVVLVERPMWDLAHMKT